MCHEYLMTSIVQKGKKSGNHNKMPWFLSSLPSASLSSGLSFLLWALLCADDTHCSQMRWQHILSAGDDEEVLSGGKREEAKKPHRQKEQDGKRAQTERSGGREGDMGHRGLFEKKCLLSAQHEIIEADFSPIITN